MVVAPLKNAKIVRASREPSPQPETAG
jgi:hypothetical protein